MLWTDISIGLGIVASVCALISFWWKARKVVNPWIGRVFSTLVGRR